MPTLPAERNAIVPVDALRYSFHAVVPWEVAGMLLERVPQGARVLDVGCGTGVLSRLLKERRDAIVMGIEPNPVRAAATRESGIHVYEGYLDRGIDELGGPFDVILFADVLEHIPDPVATLRLAVDYLHQDGCVIASVPNVAHWTVRWDLLWGRFDYQPCGIMDSTHLRWFTKSGAVDLFRSAGYEPTSYCVTAGTTLPDYQRRLFWKWLPTGIRGRIVRLMANSFPGLFGGQHVITAQIRRNER